MRHLAGSFKLSGIAPSRAGCLGKSTPRRFCRGDARFGRGRGPRIDVVVIRQFRDEGRHCLNDAFHSAGG